MIAFLRCGTATRQAGVAAMALVSALSAATPATATPSAATRATSTTPAAANRAVVANRTSVTSPAVEIRATVIRAAVATPAALNRAAAEAAALAHRPPAAADRAAAAIPASAGSAAPRTTIPGSGTYVVNRDFQAGVYRSLGNDSCYWQRASDATGATSSIIANDIGDGQRLVYVKPTDKVFKSISCKGWTKVTAAAMSMKSAKTTIPGDGVYFVGSDFVPGAYRSTGNKEFCYWERSRSADGASSNIIANEIAQGTLVVTITPGGVFKSSSCAPWTKIG